MIITRNTYPFSKCFQILYIFAQILKYSALFCPFLIFFGLFLPFFWKITHMPLLSRISPARVDPWGTLARSLAKDEAWPFRTILYLQLRKLLTCWRFPVIQYWLNLKIKLSWHNLSNDFDMSRNTPQTSNPLSNDW